MMPAVAPPRASGSTTRRLRHAAAAALLAAAACAGTPAPQSLPASRSELAAEVPANWPLPPAEIERRLAEDVLEVRAADGIGEGTTGALKLTLYFPAHGDTFVFKWKPVPLGDADGWNNAPRKELAAYAIQAWFLDPPDYVVPTVALRCLPLEALRAHGVAAQPSLSGMGCALGALSIWLRDVTVPDPVLDPSRFERDPRYATRLGQFNLLTYLIKHQDGRPGNFLASKDPEQPRVFAVDNGIAFDAWVHNWFVANWDLIRIPALPRAAIERLRGIGRRELDRLGVLTELRVDAEGMLVRVTPGPNRDPEQGARSEPGWLQLGLTRAEIDSIEARLAALLARVDRGELQLF
jgi:hypothetical protein